MKSYELKPTEENLLSTYLNDSIGRNKDIYMFSDMLNSIDDNCSIALDGNWGSGKTFFVKQVKLFLDANNSLIKKINEDECTKIKRKWKSTHKKENINFLPQVSVYYDAWENDNDDDPIISLVYSILKNVDTDFTFSEGSNIVQMGSAILEIITGRNWHSLIESLKGSSPFDKLRESKNLEQEINDFLDGILAERGERLVIFIDELDRCKPSYAVKLLERIKHYFTNNRITFVFSININELQHTIKKFYGSDFSATRYLDRFFDLRVTLPEIDLNSFYQNIKLDSDNYMYDYVCREVIEYYKFTLREIEKFVRLSKIAAYKPMHSSSEKFIFNDGRAKKFGLIYIVPVIIGLKIYDTKLFEDFVNGKNCQPLIAIANRLDKSCFKHLLSTQEGFEEENINNRPVTVEEKMKEVYEAIFVKNYTVDDYQTTIGNYAFNKNTKEMILRTSSLLSVYTSFDFDDEE